METLAAIIKAAREGGFTQGDVLMKLLSRNEVSHLVKAMAVQACTAAGNERLGVIFDSMRNSTQQRNAGMVSVQKSAGAATRQIVPRSIPRT